MTDQPSKQIMKKLDCVRQVSNLTTLKSTFKFDNKKYDQKDFLANIDTYSPKVVALLQKIKELDEHDKAKYGKKFKHVIFSDLKKGYGDKLIVAGLIANGFKSIYKPSKTKLVFDEDILNNHSEKKFALLTTLPVYGLKIGSHFKKDIFSTYNERPNNVYGQKCRFLILSSDFKEGVDCFDVRHIHLLEPQTSRANEKQAIGRATRTCGQKGLNFIPNQGWALHVHIYDTELSSRAKERYGVKTMHDLYLTGFDLRKIAFAAELDKYTVVSSVDYLLNKSVHNFRVEDEPVSFKLFEDSHVGGGRFVDCKGKCGKTPTPTVPATVAHMLLAWMSMGRLVSKSHKQRVREYFCFAMKHDPLFCQRVDEAYDNDIRFAIKHKIVLNHIYPQMADDYKRQVAKAMNRILAKPVMPFVAKQAIITSNFLQYAWPKAVIENQCEESKTSKPKEFKFLPTQEFVRHYFTPSSPEKGLLLYHGVGCGKTCSGIAMASTSFEPEGYTILWVTRASLKSDIWKNMFGQVCNVILKDKLEKEGKKMPSSLSDQKKLLSKSWKIQPMSYKQFTNLITKKNKKLYSELTKINGTYDPLRKTLLIIDEAHKLYGGDDLAAQERPNTEKLLEMIRHSYRISGQDSVKVVLMTATPFTNDPMELIKLINICRESPLPDTFDAFADKFLNEDGTFSKGGKVDFMNEMAGYVSYLNRELDARQFAQPHIHTVLVPMSERKLDVTSNKELAKKYKDLAKDKDEAIEASKEEKRDLAERGKQITQDIKNLPKCTRMKGEEKERCKEQVERQKQVLLNQKEALADEREGLNEKIAEVTREKKALKSAKKKESEILKNDFSQEKVLVDKCKM